MLPGALMVGVTRCPHGRGLLLLCQVQALIVQACCCALRAGGSTVGRGASAFISKPSMQRITVLQKMSSKLQSSS